MNHKISTIVIIFMILIFGSYFTLGYLTSGEIDSVCDEDNHTLFRWNGTWGCANLLDSNVLNFTVNNITNIYNNYSLYSNQSSYGQDGFTVVGDTNITGDSTFDNITSTYFTLLPDPTEPVFRSRVNFWGGLLGGNVPTWISGSHSGSSGYYSNDAVDHSFEFKNYGAGEFDLNLTDDLNLFKDTSSINFNPDSGSTDYSIYSDGNELIFTDNDGQFMNLQSDGDLDIDGSYYGDGSHLTGLNTPLWTNDSSGNATWDGGLNITGRSISLGQTMEDWEKLQYIYFWNNLTRRNEYLMYRPQGNKFYISTGLTVIGEFNASANVNAEKIIVQKDGGDGNFTADNFYANGSLTSVRHSDPTYITNDGDGSVILGYQEYSPFPAFPQLGGVGKMISSGKGSIVAGYAWATLGSNSTIQALGDGSFAGGATEIGLTNISSSKSGGFSWGAGNLFNDHTAGFAFGEDIILNGTNKKEGFCVGAQQSVAESYGIALGFGNNIANGATFAAGALGRSNFVSGQSAFCVGQNNNCVHDFSYLLGKGLSSSGSTQAKFGLDTNYILVNGTGIYSNQSNVMSITGDYSVGECYLNITGGFITGTNCTSI